VSDKSGSVAAAPSAAEGESTGDRGAGGAGRTLVVVVVAAAIAFFLFLLNQVQPAKEADGLPAPAVSYAAPGDQARAELAGLLERGRQEVDQNAIYQRGERFRADGANADAYILYFFAARRGHGPSAFRLGTMADPAHHDAYRDVLPAPDLYQALKWYRQASAAGVGEASEALVELTALIRQRAADGDDEARRLLLEVE